MKLKYIVDQECLVKEYVVNLGLSNRLLKKVKNNDGFYINGEKAKNYYPLKKGDVLELEYFEKMNNEYQESDKELKIIYEDDYMLVIEKDIHIASQPSETHPLDNVLSMAKNYFNKNNINANIHLVNRLDYPTSGLMIISKSSLFHYQMTKTNIEKKYICEVEGILDEKIATIKTGINRYKAPDIRRFVDNENGKIAITKYQVIKEKDNSSFLEVELLTGRCHQIRVHMSYIKHPIIGDKLYGSALEEDTNAILHLHAYSLKFIHPVTNELLELVSYPKWID